MVMFGNYKQTFNIMIPKAKIPAFLIVYCGGYNRQQYDIEM
jgi:hypothetical protein